MEPIDDEMAGRYERATLAAPSGRSTLDEAYDVLAARLFDEGEDPLVGTLVGGRYRLLRLIGRGGMGVVYLAEHVHLERRVAVKLLAGDLAGRSELADRLLGEARAASAIRHENIVEIHDSGLTDDGRPYLVMEYLEGRDLASHVREGRLALRRARDIALQICHALGVAHARGLIHRDLKAENIFLVQRELRDDHVKVLDFGIARVVDGRSPRLTGDGVVLGTAEYMAPEQARGASIDHRVDVYATGCLLYEMITGRTPFIGETPIGVIIQQLHTAPIPPSQRLPPGALPADLEAVVMRAIEKDPARRFPSMRELAGALLACRALPGPSPESARRSAGGRLLGPADAGARRDAALAVVRLAEAVGDLERAVEAAERAIACDRAGIDAPGLAPHLALLERTWSRACGPLERRVRAVASRAPLDARAAFVHSRAECPITLADLVDVSGMPRLEALRIAARLVASGALVDAEEVCAAELGAGGAP